MFKKLKEKWKVSWADFTLIFCTFAIGGSFCGYLGRQILSLVVEEKNAVYYILYVVLVTLLWPICVIIISLPLGQFIFFKKYLAKMRARIFGKS